MAFFNTSRTSDASANRIGADRVVVGNRRRKPNRVADQVVGNLECAVLLVNATDRGTAIRQD